MSWEPYIDRPFLAVLKLKPVLLFIWLHFFYFSLLELINCLPTAGNVSLWWRLSWCETGSHYKLRILTVSRSLYINKICSADFKKVSVVLGVATISQLEKHPFHNFLLKGCPFCLTFCCPLLTFLLPGVLVSLTVSPRSPD